MRRALRRFTWNIVYGAAFGVGLVVGTEILRGRLSRSLFRGIGRLYRAGDDILTGPGRWRRLISYFTLREKR